MNETDDTAPEADPPVVWADMPERPCKLCGKASPDVRRRIPMVGAPLLCRACFEKPGEKA